MSTLIMFDMIAYTYSNRISMYLLAICVSKIDIIFVYRTVHVYSILTGALLLISVN